MVAAVNRYMVEMRNSGYRESYRKETLIGAVKGYRRKVEEDATGRRPLYREASEGARERYMGKISANSSWFQKKGEPDITMEDFHTKEAPMEETGPSKRLG